MDISNLILNDFGIKFKMIEKENSYFNSIPFILKKIYNFSLAAIGNELFIIAEQKNEIQYTSKIYANHSEIISKASKLKVIFILNYMLPYNRNRIIKKRINFIIPNKQIFLPNLLINLNNYRFKKTQSIKNFSPATQCLILYHLQKSSIENKSFKEIANETKYTEMTVSRAVRELIDLKISEEKRNKNVEINFNKNKKEIWESSLPYFTTPIIKTFYTDEFPKKDDYRISDINALSHYTDISGNEQKTFAIWKNDFYKLTQKLNLNTNLTEGEFKIEVWKYSPNLLTNTHFIDPLSLFLMFKDSKDERIESELNKLISSLW